MAFESLTDRLQQAMGRLRRKGKVTEADVKEMMREIRLALLEAAKIKRERIRQSLFP